MEVEARDILRNVLATRKQVHPSPAEAFQSRFACFGGVADPTGRRV